MIDADERWLRAREDALFVVYEDGARLGKFDFSGKLLTSTAAAQRDSLRAPPRFAWIAADLHGNVYATDTANGAINKFDVNLEFLTRYGEAGEGPYQLNEPRGIAIWRRFGQVLVAEKEGAQYFFVGTDVQLPDGPLQLLRVDTEAGPRWAFDAFFTEPTELTVRFLGGDSAVVDSLALPAPVGSGRVRVVLEGEHELQSDLRERAARIVLEPKPTYSSRKRFARRIEREIAWVEDPVRATAGTLADSLGASQP